MSTNMPDQNPLIAASEKFLDRDFNQCFAQMRHYDAQIVDVLKFTFTAYTAIIGICVGLHQFSIKESNDLDPIGTAIASVGFLFGVLMTTLIVRNRVYFVLVARYINEHRRLFLAAKPLGFENKTGMYTSLTQPQFFNWRSSQSLMLCLVALLNSILFTAVLFPYTEVWLDLLGGALSLLLHLGAAIAYLRSRDDKTADKAVFGADAAKEPPRIHLPHTEP